MERLLAGEALNFKFVAKSSDPEIELEIKLESELRDKFDEIFDKIWSKTLDKVDKIASAILK
jgi:hypothetical protein